MELRFKATVENENLFFDDPEKFQKYLDTLNGKEVSVAVKRWREQKSHAQNRYYWGVVVQVMADELGYSRDEMHSAISQHFLTVDPEDGRPPYVQSTRLDEWTTSEWEAYTEMVRQWAFGEFGIMIPLPNEVE